MKLQRSASDITIKGHVRKANVLVRVHIMDLQTCMFTLWGPCAGIICSLGSRFLCSLHRATWRLWLLVRIGLHSVPHRVFLILLACMPMATLRAARCAEPFLCRSKKIYSFSLFHDLLVYLFIPLMCSPWGHWPLTSLSSAGEHIATAGLSSKH